VSARAATWLAWSLCGLTLAMVACLMVLAILNHHAQNILPVVLPVSSAVVGGLVASRRPSNTVGWLFLGSALSVAFVGLTGEYAVYGIVTNPGTLPLAQVVAWLSKSVALVGPVLGLILLPLYFPDGKAASPRWSLVAWLSLGTLLVATVVSAFSPGEAVYGSGIPNPLVIEALRPVADVFELTTLVVFMGFLFAAAASLIVRFRRAGGEERQQIKWFTYAAAAIPVWYTVNYPIDAAFPALFLVVDAMVSGALPIAAGIAILKYRLYDIDVIINRTLVYGALTALLVAVYFGGVATTQAIFRALTGQEEQPQLAIVVSTLVIAALFNPLRRRIQSFIDRRFYRRKYDARKTLEAFSAKLRDETDLEALNNELVRVVRDTMQPAHVSLWLRPDGASKKEDVPA
jgi:hypothetical protein